MKRKQRVIVGMSGGVDSSVAAHILKEQGYEVIGLFMRNWEDKDPQYGKCLAEEDYKDVIEVCEKIGIAYYSIDFVKEYWDGVFEDFLYGYKNGITPNPDILCNREIKFKAFYNKAMDIGGDYMATGHYCRVGDGGTLLKGLDPNKDQSYFLYTVKKEVLKNVLFPIGEMVKGEVRELAKKYDIPTSTKKDSTGICFIGERNFSKFLQQYIVSKEGDFITLDGNKVGTHQGASYYTIGQRKGLGIGGPGGPWFVTHKDMQNNVVYVCEGTNNPALFSKCLLAKDSSWVDGIGPQIPMNCKAKIRYRQEDAKCSAELVDGNELKVTFEEPQRAIAPGQSVVFYDNDKCLGGAFITKSVCH